MENREKLEIPTIVFTEVTLLNTGASSTCTDPTALIDSGKDTCQEDFHIWNWLNFGNENSSIYRIVSSFVGVRKAST